MTSNGCSLDDRDEKRRHLAEIHDVLSSRAPAVCQLSPDRFDSDATLLPKLPVVGISWTKGRNMEFISRFVDQPMLQGASRALQIWHEKSRRSPDELGPAWELIVISCLIAVSCWFLSGTGWLIAASTLMLLSLRPAWNLLAGPKRGDYDARAYRARAALAIRKRETEWSVRMLVLLISVCLPMIARAGDQSGELFILGAGVWFVLTVPVNAYLAAAEPPKPNDGDFAFTRNRTLAAF